MRKTLERGPRGSTTAIIIIVVLLLFSCNAGFVSAGLNYAPPEAIYGYVRDSSGNPISGASVVDLTGDGSTTSASDGRYAFGVSSGGTHQVKATKIGYADQTIGVFVSTRTGVGTGDFSLVLTHNNLAEFSKTSYPDDQHIIINYVHANDGGTLSISLYKSDGTLAQTFSNLPVGSGSRSFPIYGQQPGIWKMVATSSVYGSWQRDVPVGFITIGYNTYVDEFNGLLVGMGTKAAWGSDTQGVTISVGAQVYSYVNEGPGLEHVINIRVATKYMDNNPQQGSDGVNVVSLCIEKVAWDPDGSGPKQPYGSQYSILLSAIEVRNGMQRFSASDVLVYPGGSSSLGVIGTVAISAVTAAVSAGPGLVLDLAAAAAMNAYDAWLTNQFYSDFGTTGGAGATWNSQAYARNTEATTFNMVKLYLDDVATTYAFKICAVVGAYSNGVSYELVSSPFYICVTP